MSRILFYSPFNQRSRDTESLMIAFRQQGHHITSLSQAAGNQIHEYLQGHGIATFSHQVKNTSSAVYFFKHIYFLIGFCRKHRIDIVYSHLESANFVAVIAQYFIKASVYIVRHHVNEAALRGFDHSFLYRITYFLARKIIVVSDKAVVYMTEVEKINPSKIIKINLAYDFSLYSKADVKIASEIRKNAATGFLLLTACRLTKYKRADLSIKVLRNILDRGIDAKLILLGSGEEESSLRLLAQQEGISDKVIMPGYVSNMIDFLAASDMLLHPSLLESSCVIVKEAAITNVPVVVCKDVGDFDDYIVDKENAFMVEQDNFVKEAAAVIITNYGNKKELQRIAGNLRAIVFDLFGIEKVVERYKELNA